MKNWADSLKYLELLRVELDFGTWKHVFLELKSLLNLIDFYMERGAYSFSGSSSHLRCEDVPEPGDFTAIASLDCNDNYAHDVFYIR